METKSISCLEDNIGYKFKNRKYLEIAMTHSSYANEKKKGYESNERQEFLGDSVLSIVVSDYIFKHCPNFPEGDLSKLRAAVVCEKSLCKFSEELEVGSFLKLSKGERLSNGSSRPSILADAFEAIIAAIYLDGGLEEARRFILRFVEPVIKSPKPKVFRDYKTKLQEIIQQNKGEVLQYVLVSETGPDHDKHFVSQVQLNSNVIGKGGGRSKKDAEQEAARQALELMGH